MANKSSQKRARVIAFYLPQFHPIPENDAWWGRGFTEWTNVAAARPLFSGHHQPNIPADLGFYDLRLRETRVAQAELASRYGVEGFCYWHYWFAGRRLLERPFEEVLTASDPNFPFCLGWANESWTGVWAGKPGQVLVEQTYPGEADDKAHFEYLLRAFLDSRYMRVDGKPLFLIYRPLRIPQLRERLDQWRKMAKQAGLPGLFLVGMNHVDFDDTRPFGLDAAVVTPFGKNMLNGKVRNLSNRIVWALRRRAHLGGPQTIAYREAIGHLIPDLEQFSFEAYPCVFSNWDTTPRHGRRGLVLTNSTPELFGQHVRDACDAVSNRPFEHRLVFLKSWNEWAEGNYVEPDVRWGKAYLESLEGALT